MKGWAIPVIILMVGLAVLVLFYGSFNVTIQEYGL